MIAVNIPQKRIYFACDFATAFYFITRHLTPYYVEERPCWMPAAGELEGTNGWTLEWKDD